MGQFVLVFKYLPVLMNIIETVMNLVALYNSKHRAIAANQNTDIEDKGIQKNLQKISDTIYGLLPDEVHTTATKEELQVFVTNLEQFITEGASLVEAGVKLTK